MLVWACSAQVLMCRIPVGSHVSFRAGASGAAHIRLNSASALQYCGMWAPTDASTMLSDDILQRDEEIAETYGALTFLMMAARMSRGLGYMRGWPNRALCILKGGALARTTVEALKADWFAYRRLKELADAGDRAAAILVHRSCMATPPVKQLALALEADGWQITKRFVSWLAAKELRLVSSQICEVAFRVMKNNPLIKGKKRFMVPHKAAYIVAKKQAYMWDGDVGQAITLNRCQFRRGASQVSCGKVACASSRAGHGFLATRDRVNPAFARPASHAQWVVCNAAAGPVLRHTRAKPLIPSCLHGQSASQQGCPCIGLFTQSRRAKCSGASLHIAPRLEERAVQCCAMLAHTKAAQSYLGRISPVFMVRLPHPQTLCCKVVERVHHYERPMDMGAATRNVKLHRDAYQPRGKSSSLDFGGIRSGGPSPPWYSPKATDYNVMFADLELALHIVSTTPARTDFRQVGMDRRDVQLQAWCHGEAGLGQPMVSPLEVRAWLLCPCVACAVLRPLVGARLGLLQLAALLRSDFACD